MAVGLYNGPNVSTGNGVTTIFPYTFEILDDGDLAVYADDVLQASGYTVSGVGDAVGGNVTFAVAPATGVEIRLQRAAAYSRQVDYQRNGSFDEETVDSDFDRAVMLIQQLKALTDRSPKVPSGSSMAGDSFELPAPAGASAIGWNAAGTALVNYVLQTGTTLVSLAATTGAALVGWIQSGAGAVIRTVSDKLRDTVDIRDFGAACDATVVAGEVASGTDDTAAVQAAVTAAAAAGKRLVHSRGKCKITSTITMPDLLDFVCAKGAEFLYTGANACFKNGVVNVRGGVSNIDLNISLFTASNKGIHLLNQTRGIINASINGYIPDSYGPVDFAARTNVGIYNETDGADHGWNMFPRLNLHHLHTGLQDAGTVAFPIGNNDYGVIYYFGDYSYGDTGSVGIQVSRSSNSKIRGGSMEYYGDSGIHIQGASEDWDIGPLWYETPAGGGVGVIFEADCHYNKVEVTNTVFTQGTGAANTGYWDKAGDNMVVRGNRHDVYNERVLNLQEVIAGLQLGAAPQALSGTSNSLRNAGASTAGTWAEHFNRVAGLTNGGGAAVILTGEFAAKGTARVYVSGNESGGITHSFFDTLIWSAGSVGNANFVEVKTNTGSDSAGTATRTYTVVGNTLKLLVSGGTYSVNVYAVEANQPIA